MKIIVFIRDRVIGMNKNGKWHCIKLPSDVQDIYKFAYSLAGSEPFTIQMV